MSNSVELVRAADADRSVVAKLMQFYIYDFTELLAPEKIPPLLEAGHFGDYPGLESYWKEPDRSAWLIRADGGLAGFALLNKQRHLGLPVDFNMAEFFVARPFRRRGVARAAFHQLLALHPGQWEIAIGAYNTPAQDFWPRAVAAADVTGVETLEGDGAAWTGPILRFRA